MRVKIMHMLIIMNVIIHHYYYKISVDKFPQAAGYACLLSIRMVLPLHYGPAALKTITLLFFTD
jgi:hypothetical protein